MHTSREEARGLERLWSSRQSRRSADRICDVVKYTSAEVTHEPTCRSSEGVRAHEKGAGVPYLSTCDEVTWYWSTLDVCDDAARRWWTGKGERGRAR